MPVYKDELQSQIKLVLQSNGTLKERQKILCLLQLEQHFNSLKPIVVNVDNKAVRCSLRFHFEQLR